MVDVVAGAHVLVGAQLGQAAAGHLVCGLQHLLWIGRVGSGQKAHPRGLVARILFVVEGEHCGPVERFFLPNRLHALPVALIHGQIPQRHRVHRTHGLPVEPAGVAVAVGHQ